MSAEIGHKGLAEAHDLGVALTHGIEVASVLAPAQGKSGQAILENLFEGQELQDPKVHRSVESESSFIGPDGVIHFNPKTPIDMSIALAVDPRDPEQDRPVGFDQPFKDLRLEAFRMLFEGQRC